MAFYKTSKSAVLYIFLFSLIFTVTNRAYASGCNASEWEKINTTIAQIYQASLYGQFEKVALLTQQLNASLSPTCTQALSSFNQGGYGGYGDYGGYQSGNIYDHGGGAYSTGDVYCGPSGCY